MRGYRGTRESLFYKKVDKTTTCWLWTGSRNHNGYGTFKVGDRTMLAHRYSFLLHNGHLPDNLCVCHRCDTPRCVNPEHLFLGTNKDNSLDCVRKQRTSRGEDRPDALLTYEQADEIRALFEAGMWQKDIAELYGVANAVVSKIIAGKTYNTGQEVKQYTNRAANRSGDRHPGAKLTAEQAYELRSLYETGLFTQKQLGEHYCVSRSAVSTVLSGRVWKDV